MNIEHQYLSSVDKKDAKVGQRLLTSDEIEKRKKKAEYARLYRLKQKKSPPKIIKLRAHESDKPTESSSIGSKDETPEEREKRLQYLREYRLNKKREMEQPVFRYYHPETIVQDAYLNLENFDIDKLEWSETVFISLADPRFCKLKGRNVCWNYVRELLLSNEWNFKIYHILETFACGNTVVPLSVLLERNHRKKIQLRLLTNLDRMFNKGLVPIIDIKVLNEYHISRNLADGDMN